MSQMNPNPKIAEMEQAADALTTALAKLHVPFDADTFRWEGLQSREYKLNEGSELGMGWKGITRLGLGRPPMLPVQFALRYFEIEPGGYSSLEKHAHAHLIVVVRGSGIALVGDQLFRLSPLDLLTVPSMTPHRWINEGEEPFGFLCPVDAERDRPQPVSEEEWQQMKENPLTAPYVF